ncbi:Y-family DNA polymerase [Desulfovibrio subterraneus]|uniref:UmuC protein n=1 Tax=Desulfovibrio subterraneus TaxID=2718620 RepID=A0A7J0BHP3_9BACT|nr:Y-family DNA polymerase [Desulfovibrio subterraneus]GFM32741.1 umuC protein [Desulfovibrio subterraneus]
MTVAASSLPVYALVDCNNFYCSCERVFRPDLVNRPVVVLSNNDGCVIARSNEAKTLGIPMGAPYYKHKQMMERTGTTVFSSNYALYGDMSSRVMQVLGSFSPDMEVYSIDEAFLRLDGFRSRDLARYAQDLRGQVAQWTGIPVSVGMGPTRTLAKIAGRVGKKIPACEGVFDISRYWDTPAAVDRILDTVAAGDVWGVGRRYADMLAGHRVHTARQLRDMPDYWVRKHMTVTGLHTVLELRGISCMDLDAAPAPRRSIVSSRSFGRPVETYAEAHEAVADYMTRAAEKLRRESLVAHTVGVVVRTNSFKKEEAQYSSFQTRNLARPTDYTPFLLQEGKALLDALFKEGYRYKKVGVMLSGLEPKYGGQYNLLDCMTGETDRDKARDTLMRATDAINARFGRGTVEFAAGGVKKEWQMRQEFRSPHYTTDWKELAVVR